MQAGLASLLHLGLKTSALNFGIFIPMLIVTLLVVSNSLKTKEGQNSPYRPLAELGLLSLLIFSSNVFTLALGLIFLNLYRSKYPLAMRLAEICLLGAIVHSNNQIASIIDQGLYFIPVGILLGSVEWKTIAAEIKNIHHSYVLFHQALIPLVSCIAILCKIDFTSTTLIALASALALAFFIPKFSEHILSKVATFQDIPEDIYLVKVQAFAGRCLTSISIFLNRGVSVTLHENIFYIFLGIVILMTLVFNSILSVSF